MKSTGIFIPFNLQEDKTLKFARTKLRKGYTKDHLSQGPVGVNVNEITSQQIWYRFFVRGLLAKIMYIYV